MQAGGVNMKVSSEFVEYILDMLSPVGEVRIFRMFGGALLKVEGVQLGVIFAETLYLKVTDSALQEKYKKLGSEQFTYTRKDKKDPVIIKNWWSVPEEMMDDTDALVTMAEEVIQQDR